jgi:hypothetical protein
MRRRAEGWAPSAVYQARRACPNLVALKKAVVSRDGEFEGRVHCVVSPNGGSLTLSAIGRDGVEQVSVFDRADL